MIHTTTNKGLHDCLGEQVLAHFVHWGLKAADLGFGPGARAVRLHQTGRGVIAADQSAYRFAPQLPHLTVNFDQTDFAAKLGEGTSGTVTTIEALCR